MTTPTAARRGLAERLAPFSSTIFTEMTELAKRTQSINLGQGFPDTDGPPAMLEAAQKAIAEGVNQYSPGRGYLPLRQAIANDRATRYGTVYDPETEILITVGATEALTCAILALVEPGEEVVALEPCYDSYAPAVAMAHGTLVGVPLVPKDGKFVFDLGRFAEAITPRTRLLLLNTPHNPTGTVLTNDELGEIARLAAEHDLIVLTDEVYEHLIFDGLKHRPIAALPGMAERTLSCSGAGKTFNATGWKTGWVCGPASLVNAVLAVKQYVTFVGAAPLQPAVALALRTQDGWIRGLRASLLDNRDRLATGLADAGFLVYPATGTYFLTADPAPLGHPDGVEFCHWLANEVGVAAIPYAGLSDRHDLYGSLVRFAFCKRPEVLDEALARLAQLNG
ncbi:MAG: pyridoxal phosphate-dependent aminotransferase [Segniliparus sp.]|uniref:pyridoxal phosphate-dependent aminotransferase n=1 Tax=Segniliparus sp. TaxID=2804064 RepID=UPI003F33DE72